MSNKILVVTLLFASSVWAGPPRPTTEYIGPEGLFLKDGPSGEVRLCGLDKPELNEGQKLLVIAEKLKCETIENLEDHCGCVRKYDGSSLSKEDADRIEQELGFLAFEASTIQQKTLNDLTNVSALFGSYGFDLVGSSCLDEKEMEEFQKASLEHIKDSVGKKEEKTNLFRKDFYDSAMNLNKVKLISDKAREADAALLADLANLIKVKKLKPKLDRTLPENSTLNYSKKSTHPKFTDFIESKSSVVIDETELLTSTTDDADNVELVSDFLENTSHVYDKYKDSALLKVFSQVGTTNRFSFGDYLGRLSLKADKIRENSIPISMVGAVSRASALLPLGPFLDGECKRIAENVKYNASLNYADGKLSSEASIAKQIVSERSGEVLLSPADKDLSPVTVEGKSNISSLNSLRNLYAKRYRENFSSLDKDDSSIKRVEKSFDFSRLLCGKVLKIEQTKFVADKINNSNKSQSYIDEIEKAKIQSLSAEKEIERLSLEQVQLERRMVTLGNSMNQLLVRQNELESKIAELEKEDPMADPFFPREAYKQKLQDELEEIKAGVGDLHAVITKESQRSNEIKDKIVEQESARVEAVRKINIPNLDSPMTSSAKELASVYFPTATLAIKSVTDLVSDREDASRYRLKSNLIDSYRVEYQVETTGDGTEREVKRLVRDEREKDVYTSSTVGQEKIELVDKDTNSSRALISDAKRSLFLNTAYSDTMCGEACNKAFSWEKRFDKYMEVDSEENPFIRAQPFREKVEKIDAVIVPGSMIEIAETEKPLNEETLKSKEKGDEIVRQSEDGEKTTEAKRIADAAIAELRERVASSVPNADPEGRKLVEEAYKDADSNGNFGDESRKTAAALLGAITENPHVAAQGALSGGINRLLLNTSRSLDREGSKYEDEAEGLGKALASAVKSDTDKIVELAEQKLIERGYGPAEKVESTSTASAATEVNSLRNQRKSLKRENLLKQQKVKDMQINRMNMERQANLAKERYEATKARLSKPGSSVSEFERKIADINFQDEDTNEKTIASKVEVEKPQKSQDSVQSSISTPVETSQPAELAKAAVAETQKAQKQQASFITPPKPKTKSSASSSGGSRRAPASFGGGGSVASAASSSNGIGRGPASVQNDYVAPQLSVPSTKELNLNDKKFEVTPIIEGLDDELYVRIPNFDAPKDFLKLSDSKREDWVQKQFIESEALEAIVVLPTGKKLLVKKK